MLALTVITAALLSALTIFFIFRRKIRTLNLPRVFVIIAVIALAAGIWGLFSLDEQIRSGFTRRDWPTAEATISRSEIGGSRASHPVIHYIYQVSGREYSGVTDLHHPGFGGRRARRDAAERVIESYPPGKQITIHYNPGNPAESYIRIGPYYSDYLALSLAALLITAALLILIMGLNHRHQLKIKQEI